MIQLKRIRPNNCYLHVSTNQLFFTGIQKIPLFNKTLWKLKLSDTVLHYKLDFEGIT